MTPADFTQQEFHAKSVRAQMSLMDQMAWASSLADKSKSKRERDEPTAEEQAFAGLLDANEQLSEALKLHEEMEKMARDEREMQAAEERSRKETRLDRSVSLVPNFNALTPHSRLRDSFTRAH